MAVWSKHNLDFTCYEVGHTWTPFCTHAAAGIGMYCFEEALKIYSSVYLLSLMLAGKVPTTRDWKKVLLAILQSSVFLGLNGAGFIGSFCVVRNLLRQFNIVSSAFLPSFIANYLAILVERPSRRPALAVYVTNVASETVYNMLVARGIVRPIAHGQVLIFSLTLAALFRWFRTNRQTSSFQHKLLTFLVGNQELHPLKVTSNVPEPSAVTPKAPAAADASLLGKKHPLCSHNGGCVKYSFHALVKTFLYGWGLHSCIGLVVSLPRLFRRPSRFPALLRQSKHVRFGAFLASLSAAYRAVHCLLRWLRGKDSNSHSTVAGLVSGLSIMFYPNPTIVLYLAWKTVETLYYCGMESGLVPYVPGFAKILYSFSTAVLFHAAVLEPHNLKPAYWRFLCRITNDKIAEMNREYFEEFQTQSSKMLPDFRANYNMEHVGDLFKSWLASLPPK